MNTDEKRFSLDAAAPEKEIPINVFWLGWGIAVFAQKRSVLFCRELILSVALGCCMGLLAPESGLAQPNSLSVNVLQPAAGALSGDNLWVCATIISTFEISQCTAQVEGHQVGLVFALNAYYDKYGGHPGWTNTLSLSGLARGTKILSVKVTDLLANSAQAQQTFVYDQKPVLTITAPLDQTVARPGVHMAASCTDDDPAGCSLQVSVGGVVVAAGHDRLVQDVSLAGFDESWMTLHFVAIDSAGQQAASDVNVAVESSVRLIQVLEVPGPILNVEPTRVLFMESWSDRGVLKIRDRTTKLDTVVMNQAGKFPEYGALAPKGAIFVEQSGDVLTAMVYDERDGQLVQLGMPNSNGSLVVKGNYAIWSSGQTLILRNLLAGTNTTVSTSAGNWQNDVAANGDVVFWGYPPPSYNIFRYRAGTVTQLTTDAQLWNTYVLTDGSNVVYRKHDPCCGNQRYGLFLHEETHEIELAPLALRPEPNRGSDYQVNGGWVAFTRLGSGGQRQVWTRSPNGTLTQLTFYGDSSSIDTLAANGELLFWHGGFRYLSRPGQTLVEVGHTLGGYFWQNGQWWVTIGRSLFQFRPNNTTVTLSSAKFAADGKFRFWVNAGEGQTVAIQASRNLVEWTNVVTTTVSGGAVEFADEVTGSFDRRFYRGITPLGEPSEKMQSVLLSNRGL